MSESAGGAKGREMAKKVFDLALQESKSIHLRIIGHEDSTHTITIKIRTRAKIEQATLDQLEDVAILRVGS